MLLYAVAKEKLPSEVLAQEKLSTPFIECGGAVTLIQLHR